MKTTLYVFSATGNSLTSANLLAKHLRADVIPVASTKHLTEITENSEAVGFVFPVYYGNMPYPVREMIEKMTFSEKTYVFTVATYRGHAGDVAKRMDTLLKTRGGKLSLALGLPMPGNSFINKPETDAGILCGDATEIIGGVNGRFLERGICGIVVLFFCQNGRDELFDIFFLSF